VLAVDEELVMQNICNWYETLTSWEQLLLCIPALLAMFGLYYALFAIAGEWRKQSQHERDRAALKAAANNPMFDHNQD
jgi:hypothetical protein